MARSARPVRFRDKWRIRWLDHERRRCSALFETYGDADRALRVRQVEVDEVKLIDDVSGPDDPDVTGATLGLVQRYRGNIVPSGNDLKFAITWASFFGSRTAAQYLSVMPSHALVALKVAWVWR